MPVIRVNVLRFPEVVARVYNDIDEVFYTDIEPVLHEMYSEQIELKFENMPGGKLTVEDCKKKMADAKLKLQTVRRSDQQTCGFKRTCT